MDIEYRYKLHAIWELSQSTKPFLDWLIDESELNHKRSVRMAGDLGEALSKIGDLERIIDLHIKKVNYNDK